MEDLRADAGPPQEPHDTEYGPNGFDCDRCGALIECAPNPDRTTATYVADYFIVPGGSEDIVCHRCAVELGLAS